jgi:hypothetical protein
MGLMPIGRCRRVRSLSASRCAALALFVRKPLRRATNRMRQMNCARMLEGAEMRARERASLLGCKQANDTDF